MTVTQEEKRKFIRSFLRDFELQKKECKWILQHILLNDSLSENVHFVDNIENCTNAMILSTTCANDLPAFAGVIRNIATTDANKMYNYVRLHEKEKFYVKLNFHNKHQHTDFMQVLEENPNVEAKRLNEFSSIADAVIHHSMLKFKLTELENQINDALDMRDEKRFRELSEQYKQAREELESVE